MSVNFPLLGAAALLIPAAFVLAPELRSNKGKHDRELRREMDRDARLPALADLLPYRRLIRPTVIKNADGSYLAAWRIAGEDVGVLTDVEILNTAYHLAGTLGALPDNTVVQFYARRTRFGEYDRALGADHPVLQVLDDLRAETFLRKQKTYTTERTLALTWTPPSAAREQARAALSSGVEAQIRSENDLLDEFEEVCGRIDAALSSALQARRLGEVRERDRAGAEYRRSELLRFVSFVVSGEDFPINVPPPNVALNGLLAREARGGYHVQVGDLEVGCVEIDALPDSVEPRILEKLTELKLPHLLAIRVVGQSIADARSELRNAAVDFKGAANFNAGFVDPEAAAASQDAIDSFGRAAGDYTRVGRVSIVLVIRARTREKVARAQSKVVAELKNAGFTGTVRKMGAFETWLSTLPSEAKRGTRKYPIDALTVAKVFPLHERSHGRRYAESESLPSQTPALTYAFGSGNSLYRMHLNVADVFHGFGIGRTTSGKSMLLAYLSGSFRGRLPFAGVTTIDRGRSSERMCRMLDGCFYDLLGKNSPGFALFADVGDPERDRELLQILEEMVELQRGARVTPEQHERLATALRMMGQLPQANRSLYAFYELLQDPDETLRPAIHAYTRLGSLGPILDASRDTFDVGRFNAVDIANIITLEERYVIPILRVLIWKTLAQIRRMKERMGPRGRDLHWLISVDEAHSILKHEIGARFISDLQRMGRKENIGVWLWTNSLTDFLTDERTRGSMLENTPTRIYFGDPGAKTPETATLYQRLNLPSRGSDLLATLPQYSFVLHQPGAGVLKELTVGLNVDVRAIVGSSRGNHAVERFRHDFPAERYGIHRWKVELLRSEGAHDAAARLETILATQAAEAEPAPPASLVELARSLKK